MMYDVLSLSRLVSARLTESSLFTSRLTYATHTLARTRTHNTRGALLFSYFFL